MIIKNLNTLSIIIVHINFLFMINYCNNNIMVQEGIKDVAIKNILVDAEVKVLYQEDENRFIGQYIIFCKVYNEQRKKYGQTKKAVTETIRICKDRNVLKEYLENKEQEVVDIMMTLFDDEQVLEAYAEDIKNSEARKTAEKLIRKGKMSLEEIAECVPALSLEDLRKLEMEVMQLT